MSFSPLSQSVSQLSQFSCSVMSDSVNPRTAACQASLAITNSWSLLKLMSIESVTPFNHLILCHPFSSHLQSFPASESFPMSQLFISGGQSIGASASASSSILPTNIQGWFPFRVTGLIPLQFKALLRVFSNPTVQKHQFFDTHLSLWSNSFLLCGKWAFQNSYLRVSILDFNFLTFSPSFSFFHSKNWCFIQVGQ